MRQINFPLSLMCIAVILISAFSACTKANKITLEKKFFDLDIKIDARYRTHSDTGNVLLVKQFFISPEYDSCSFVYKIKTNELKQDYYNEFIRCPSRLITRKTAKALWASPYFKPASTVMEDNIDLRLSGRITALYGDLRTETGPEAVISIHMILEKKKKKTFCPLMSRTYTRKIPIYSSAPSELAAGWAKGLSEIITQFIKDYSNQHSRGCG